MSLTLWKKLPYGFLKKGFAAWNRLDHEVKLLIVELAEKQNFKCAICNANQRLEIEHDHDPEYGGGKWPTVYNIRGLACRGCNWDIMMYEKDKNGEYVGFGEATSRLQDFQWDKYTYAYECRVSALNEARLERELGPVIYWRRRNFLEKFDDWMEYGGDYPWYWGFNEIKDRKYGPFWNPKRFILMMSACIQFIKEQREKNPDFEIPESFVELMFKIKPILDELRPVIDQRLEEIRRESNLPRTT